MGRLSIDEVIGHCERRTEKYDDFYGIGYFDGAPLSDNCTKEYWEHRQVAEWLTELKEYRSLGTPAQLREVDTLYLEKCQEVNQLRAQLAAAKGEAE